MSKWTGLRGHNWGSEHAHSYAYGSCNRWDDGAVDRAIDGFTARVKIAGRLTPWMSALVYWDGNQKLEHNRIRDLFNRRTEVEPTLWRVPYRDLTLQMVGDSTYYAGLRYRHPGGRESYCYNTKFASVTVTANGRDVTSKAGEHEVLYPEPLPAIPLHPTPEWKQSDGDYQSA